MAFRLPILVLVGFFFSISAASSARADTIPVTSGALTIAWDDPSSFVLFGPGGFALSGLFIRIPSSPQGTCFAGCAPGQVINLSSVAGGGSGFTLGQSFTANVNGVEFARPDQPESWLGLTGLFQFDSSDIVAPPLPGTFDRIFLTAPFVFQGQVTGFAGDDSEAQTPLFQIDLGGRGTARLGLSPLEDGTYRFPEATYTFETLNPVPEPAAILLLGTGLARVMFLRRRKAAV
jgi:hypothetical protein